MTVLWSCIAHRLQLCRCASIDGDADRLVYFFQRAQQLVLLDGDRIALLLATLASQLLGSTTSGQQSQVGAVICMPSPRYSVRPRAPPCTYLSRA